MLIYTVLVFPRFRADVQAGLSLSEAIDRSCDPLRYTVATFVSIRSLLGSLTMRPATSSIALLASAALGYAWEDGHNKTCLSLTDNQVSAMGNNSLFTRWRPHSHFLPPAGWSNDPCGAMYDPKRDVYHMFYQWHPEHINWGNISWGHAMSKDLVTWIDAKDWKDNDALAMGPTGYGNYNGLGIFSGTGQPVNLKGEQDGTLILFYTSVAHLPTSWSIPYTPYTETQSIAISKDGGKTFHDIPQNPIINATTLTAPMHWNLTGFRDPFLERLPELDVALNVSEPHYYAVFGSGIKGVGPRIPLWTAPASDLTKWSFLGALWEPSANTSLGPLLSTGTYGFNFEVSGFFNLRDSKNKVHWYVNMGTEGGNVSFHESAHWSLWNEGTISRRANGSAAFTPVAGGAGDWGLTYAMTSFNDTKNSRRVQYGWAPEDIVGDGGLFSAKQQGYQGSLTIPRELFVHEVPFVAKTADAVANKNAVLVAEADGSYTAQTLGNKPLADVVANLRQCAKPRVWSASTRQSTILLASKGSAHMELKTTIAAASGAVGVVVGASADMREYTTITYQPSNHTILVDRSHSSSLQGFNNATVTGYFYPYTIQGFKNSTKQEPITMDVFVDGSLVEIFVNDRFALTTRIYPSSQCSTGFGLYVANGTQASFDSVQAWLGTKNVWPERPANSSSQLVWDTPGETNNYTWWSGN